MWLCLGPAYCHCFYRNFSSCNLKVCMAALWGCFFQEHTFHKCVCAEITGKLAKSQVKWLCMANLASLLPTYCFHSWCCCSRIKQVHSCVLLQSKLCQSILHTQPLHGCPQLLVEGGLQPCQGCMCLLWVQWAFVRELKYSWWEIPWRSTGRMCFESSTSTNALPLDSDLVINEHRPSLIGGNLIAAQYQNMEVLLLTVEAKRCGGRHHWCGLEGVLASESLIGVRLEGGWDRNEGGFCNILKKASF